MNMSRFAARRPDVDVMYGATRNEAFHKQPKGFFRNVIFQTGRHAKGFAAVATLAKLVAGGMGCDLTRHHEEVDLLKSAAGRLQSEPIRFVPLMDHMTEQPDAVNPDDLPRNAKKRRVTKN